jgi:hypothetical protein
MGGSEGWRWVCCYCCVPVCVSVSVCLYRSHMRGCLSIWWMGPLQAITIVSTIKYKGKNILPVPHVLFGDTYMCIFTCMSKHVTASSYRTRFVF